MFPKACLTFPGLHQAPGYVLKMLYPSGHPIPFSLEKLVVRQIFEQETFQNVMCLSFLGFFVVCFIFEAGSHVD